MNNKEYLECDLPTYLSESLTAYKNALIKIKSGETYWQLDMDYCELQSNINVAEVEQDITAEQANYLRRKYLYGE